MLITSFLVSLEVLEKAASTPHNEGVINVLRDYGFDIDLSEKEPKRPKNFSSSRQSSSKASWTIHNRDLFHYPLCFTQRWSSSFWIPHYTFRLANACLVPYLSSSTLHSVHTYLGILVNGLWPSFSLAEEQQNTALVLETNGGRLSF